MNTPQDFCLWLQGFVELQDAETITDTQWLQIKDHLKLVFDKVTPDRKVEFKPNITINKPFDYSQLKDLIGKQGDWPNSPYQITC